MPELEDLPDRYIHAPWKALEDVLNDAGLTLGEDYPEPIVNHGAARDRAMAEYDTIR